MPKCVITCEWGECQKKSKIYVILDGEKYYFCSQKCLDEFWNKIKDNY